MQTRPHYDKVDDQFGAQAQAYVTSAVHASGHDLDRLEALAAEARPERALDLGCGGGHVAYRLAAHAGAVTASDLSPAMLAAVARTAIERGLANIETVQAPAEALPFGDAQFDFLASRFTAHHWRDFEAGLRQARRVLKPGSPAVFIDGVAPRGALADTHLQAIELLRDPSHVRDYGLGEWTAALARSGFDLIEATTFRLRMEYEVWVERMRTSPTHRAAIRSLQAGASEEVRERLGIEPDGSFMLDVAMLRTRAG